MTLSHSDPLYRKARDAGLDDAAIAAIVKRNGTDGLEELLRQMEAAAQAPRGSADYAVTTEGTGNHGCAAGCAMMAVCFVSMVLVMGVADRLFSHIDNPVISFALFFVALGIAGGIAMAIMHFTSPAASYGWAMVKKHWWKILLGLWLLSAVLSALSSIFGDGGTTLPGDYPPMPEPARNPDPP